VVVYVPIVPEPLEQEPDLSFRATNDDAFARSLRYGRDIVSTYGPWGILQRGYDARTDTPVLITSGLLALAFAFGGTRVLRDGGASPAFAMLWLLCAAIILYSSFGDARFTAIPLLVVLSLLQPYSDSRELPLVAALGLVALIKISFLILAVFLIVLATLIRRSPRQVLVFAASLLAFWLAARQSPLDFVAFVRGGLAVSSGYAGASALGSGFAWAAIVSAVIAALVIACERDVFRAALLAGFIAYLLKVGYVRADLGHSAPANGILLLGAVAYLFLRRDRLIASRVALRAAAVAAVVIAGWNMPLFADRIARIVRVDRAAELRRAHDDFIERSKAAALPDVRGTIDAYPWGSAGLIARGMQYSPRPVFQSCMAWTAELGQRNAAHLRANPPDWIWAAVASIDDRLPMLDDAPSWMEIARRYDVDRDSSDHLLLRRRELQRPITTAEIAKRTVRMGEVVELPLDDALWVTIDLHPGAIARLIHAIGRPTVVTLETIDETGRASRWRVAPAQLPGGFLVSPEITNSGELAAFIQNGSGRRVRKIRLLADGFGDAYDLRIARVYTAAAAASASSRTIGYLPVKHAVQ
jgi:hypothetical protein